MKKYILILFVLSFLVNLLALDPLEKYIVDRRIGKDGSEIIGIKVPGGRPPADYVRKDIVDIQTLKTHRSVVIIDDMPAFDWSYGCSATSAAMIAAYYDRNGYPNIYTGPTNGGVMPLDNSVWNESSGGEGGDGECPLSATHQGYDGLTSLGHVDDYWIDYGSDAQDPYITGGWTQHAYADCTGDYMGTNQSYWNSSDGSTTFYTNPDGPALHDYTGGEAGDEPHKDGGYGFRQFMESRGYDVTVCFNQSIAGYNGVENGFTFAQYMAEIDANRPVMIHVTGHTMVGFGYDSSDQTIYLKNTWDYSTDTMTWGGTYSGMTHYAVSILNLGPDINNGNIEVNFNLSDTFGDGWKSGDLFNFIEFRGATITLASGFEEIRTYHLSPGDYSYTYYENDGWGNENSWEITLADGTELSSGEGITSGSGGSAFQSYTFTVPLPYSNPLPAENVTISRIGNNAQITWLPVTSDINGIDVTAYNLKYHLEMTSDPDFLTDIQQINTSDTFYTHSNAYNHEKYFYRVIAFIED